MMPKHIITAIGLIVSLGVIALAVAFIALPVYLDAVGVDSQTQAVAELNVTYEAQLESLDAQKEDLDAVDADVAALRAEIPAAGQLDDVFELVGRAASASGVTIASVTAGDQVAFLAQTGAGDSGTEPTSPQGTADGTDAGATAAPTPEPAPAESAGGRQQIDITISASAADIAQSVAFLDALRAGPRLLSSIRVTSQAGDGGIDVRISALTYVDAEG